jgi:hypothetical protein
VGQANCQCHYRGEGEPIVNKTPLSPLQRVVNSDWKAMRMLEERPAPTSKAKLYGRRGYGDADIPAPDRTPDGD